MWTIQIHEEGPYPHPRPFLTLASDGGKNDESVRVGRLEKFSARVEDLITQCVTQDRK